MKRRLLSAFSAVVLCLGLVACGGKSPVSTNTSVSKQTVTETSTTVSAAVSTRTETSTEVSTSEDTPTSVSTEPEEYNPADSEFAGCYAAYREILDWACGELLGDDTGDPVIGNGLYEILASGLNPFDLVGYVIMDLTWDGIPELVLVEIDDDGYHGKSILSAYTYQDGKAVRICEGWDRNLWYYIGGGTFVNIGSNSAANTELHVYGLAQNQTDMFELNSYHSDYDPASDSIKYYWLEEETTEEEFFEILNALEAEAINFATTTMSRYDSNCPVSVIYESDYFENYGDEFSQTSPDGAVYVVFIFEDEVYDFTLYSGNLDFDAFGNVKYTKGELYREFGSDGAGYGYDAELYFPGDNSIYIATFKDAKKNQHECMVLLSGKDGAVVVIENQ